MLETCTCNKFQMQKSKAKPTTKLIPIILHLTELFLISVLQPNIAITTTHGGCLKGTITQTFNTFLQVMTNTGLQSPRNRKLKFSKEPR